MSSVLCITLRFLDPVPQFHGRGDSGDPEWPPSPLRVFQALVCASATRWRDNPFREYARPALQWLEAIQPSIVTPQVSTESFGYRMYVPNNSGDLMTAAWARGDTETSMAKFRVEKDVRPTLLRGGDAVHYLFPFADGTCPHFDVLAAAARSVTHLGWGVDMVAGNASLLTDDEAAQLPGERWRSVADTSATGYRVPILGTLDALIEKHKSFLTRLGPDGFKPVPPLSAFRVVGYRRATDAPARSYAAFKLLHPEDDRWAWFSAMRANCVAAMTRHATANAANQQLREQDWVDSYVNGHRSTGEDTRPRFSYLPLPTIEHRGQGALVVGGIRRVILAELTEASTSYRSWARQMLPGQFLIDEKTGDSKAMLTPLNESDWVLRQYTGPSDTWASVTPVVLPGSDDGKFAKANKLFCKALRHAGYWPEALAADPEFRNVSFWPGSDLALRFQRPDYLRNGCWSVYHVRLRWKQPIKGPLALGAGRHCGLGVFARTNQ
jgi:CRISPR-associated protein Csb2